jgi:hypothetical protein
MIQFIQLYFKIFLFKNIFLLLDLLKKVIFYLLVFFNIFQVWMMLVNCYRAETADSQIKAFNLMTCLIFCFLSFLNFLHYLQTNLKASSNQHSLKYLNLFNHLSFSSFLIFQHMMVILQSHDLVS